MDSTLLPAEAGDDVVGLRRSRDDAAVAGVCFSLAQHLRIDPLLVRLAAVVLALSSGFGVLLYAAAWFLIPQEGSPRSLGQQWFPQLEAWSLRRQAKAAGIACLVGCLLLAQVGGWSIAPGLVLVLVVVLARRWKATPATQDTALPAPVATTATAGPEFLAAVQAWQQRLDQLCAQAPEASSPTWRAPVAQPRHAPTVASLAAAPLVAAPVAPATAAVVRPRRRRSWLFGLGLLAAAILAGALVPTAGADEPRLLQHAVMLAVLAVGLLLSWLVNLPRPRLAVLAGLLVIASAVAPTPTSLHPVEVAWSSPAQLPSEPVRVVATEARYDLSRMDLSGPAADTPRRFALDAKAADVELVIPRDAVVRIDYHLRAGDLTITAQGDRFSDDGGRDASWSSDPGKEPELVVDLTLTAASGTVRDA